MARESLFFDDDDDEISADPASYNDFDQASELSAPSDGGGGGPRALHPVRRARDGRRLPELGREGRGGASAAASDDVSAIEFVAEFREQSLDDFDKDAYRRWVAERAGVDFRQVELLSDHSGSVIIKYRVKGFKSKRERDEFAAAHQQHAAGALAGEQFGALAIHQNHAHPGQHPGHGAAVAPPPIISGHSDSDDSADEDDDELDLEMADLECPSPGRRRPPRRRAAPPRRPRRRRPAAAPRRPRRPEPIEPAVPKGEGPRCCLAPARDPAAWAGAPAHARRPRRRPTAEFPMPRTARPRTARPGRTRPRPRRRRSRSS